MMKSRVTIATLVIAGLAAGPFAASAKMMHKTKHHTSTSMSSSTTTGANMKPSTSKSGMMRGNTSSEGNVGPGTTNNNTTPMTTGK